MIVAVVIGGAGLGLDGVRVAAMSCVWALALLRAAAVCSAVRSVAGFGLVGVVAVCCAACSAVYSVAGFGLVGVGAAAVCSAAYSFAAAEHAAVAASQSSQMHPHQPHHLHPKPQ